MSPRRSSGTTEFVYRSRYLHEADMVAEALEQAGVAFFRAIEDPAGVRFAMPIAPRRQRGSMRTAIAVLVLLLGAAVAGAQQLPDLLAASKVVGEAPVWENKYVRVHYVALEYPPAERQVAQARPVVLYVRVTGGPGVVDTRLLDAPQGVRELWHQGVVPRGVRIELLSPPPASSALGEPGTDPPTGAIKEDHERYRLVVATFRSLDFGVGTGRLPSVTVFLSDGVVQVRSRGVRQRMGVQAGDAFWFEAFTELTVVSDDPVGAAIVQIYPR